MKQILFYLQTVNFITIQSCSISKKKLKHYQIIEVCTNKTKAHVFILLNIVNSAFSIPELFRDHLFLRILYTVLNNIEIFSVIFNNF